MFGRGFDSHRLHSSFTNLGKMLLNQRFLFFPLVFLGILFLKRDTKKDTTFVVSKKIIFLFYGRHGIRTHARCYTPTAFPTRPLKPLE